MADTLLTVRNLKKHFSTPKGTLHAVDGVSFTIERGKTLGIVGESGCGKSTTGRVILRLLEATDGEVIFAGENVLTASKTRLRQLREQMQIVFQDPFASLNPRMTVGEIIGEPLLIHKRVSNKKALNERVAELMELVGLAPRLVNAYPHELDGGRRQRIGIARALALEPQFIVCDEPVSALDVSIQAQILNLLQDLQERLGLTYIFITHDLSVVKHFCDSVAVMYLGQLIEQAPAQQLFAEPRHPYTQALLSAIPSIHPEHKMERVVLKGEISSPINPVPGCRFAPRCPHAVEKCSQTPLQMEQVASEHWVSCGMLQ